MRTTWSLHTPRQLVFGTGAVRQLGPLAARRGLERVLIVTDRTLVDIGLVDRVRESLVAGGIIVELFDGGQAEPAIEIADAAIEAAQRFRPSGLLGLGGGSNIDLSKIVAIVLSHGGRPSDYFGFDRVPGPVLPLICVPTTAGTGSEVSHAAVLTDTANAMKVSTLSNYLRPELALVDPELTYSCPQQVTADSGIDALAHAIEAYTAIDYDRLEVEPGEPTAYEGRYPLCNLIAEQAIDLIRQHLVASVRDGSNHAARDGMAQAATLAGIAFSNCGVALVHALEYPLGGALHCTHGAGNGLLLPFVMQFNLPQREATLARIATLLGRDTSSLSPAEAAQEAIHAVEQLKRDIGVPLTIRELGGDRADLPLYAERAFAVKRLLQINPRPASERDLLSIYESAF